MKNILLINMLLLLTINGFAQDTKKVLIIGIDGCRSDALIVANTPHLDDLIENGIYSPHALNNDITLSGPGWSANLCGVWSEKHLVKGNNFTINNYDNYPSIFAHVEAYDSDLHTLSICNWNPINDFIVQDAADFKLNVNSDAEVSLQMINYVEVNDPDLIFLHFDDVDHAGHASGFNPDNPAYIEAIEGIDVLVGDVVTAIKQRPNYNEEDWLILVTTDHGGNGTSHGGNSLQEQEVFFIASGKNIATTSIQKDSSFLIDDPENCLLDEVELRFDGDSDNVGIPSNELYDFGADQDFTIECRVRTSVSGDVAIIANKDWDSGNNAGFVFSFKYPSGPEWKVNIGDGSNRADINTGGMIADNEWHTLSVSFDRDGMMRMYQNGVFVDETDISSVGDIGSGQGLFLGTDITGSYEFDGAISELRIWNTIVDEESINGWYCTRLNEEHPNMNDLIGYWKLNDGEGNMVKDYSGHNNDGVLNAATWNMPDTIVVYDYSGTPKITDVPVTALDHLCVSLDSTIQLDGKSWIESCTTGTFDEITAHDISILLYPNPVKDTFKLLLDGDINKQNLVVTIRDIKGTIVYESNYTNEEEIDISKLHTGLYLLNISSKSNLSLEGNYKFIKE